MQLIFLGTGSALPIPRTAGGRKIGATEVGPRRLARRAVHDCPQCRSRDPRDRRLPSAALIDGRVLIDAGPPIAGLLTSAHIRPQRLTAVFLTHRHRDACGGLDSIPGAARIIFPGRPGVMVCAGHRVEAVRVPHDLRTWGYLVDRALAYFPDYADIHAALPALRRARVAVLDGSGWTRAFPSHQPMADVIPIVKALPNLTRIFFTHIGHTGMPHRELERRIRALGDRRFFVAYHGLRIRVSARRR